MRSNNMELLPSLASSKDATVDCSTKTVSHLVVTQASKGICCQKYWVSCPPIELMPFNLSQLLLLELPEDGTWKKWECF